MRFHASRNNALRKVACVLLQSFDTSGFEHRYIVVINGRGFDKDFFLSHGHQEPRLGDAARPLLPKLGTVLPQVGHEFGQQRLRGCRFGARADLLRLRERWFS